jgi:hypothetical protein
MTPLTPPLCVRPPSRPRAMLICGIRRDVSSSAPASPSAAVTLWFWRGDDDGNGNETEGDNAGARASFPCFLRLFALLLEDDFVLAIGGAGTGAPPFGIEAGGVASSGVAGIGVGSTHSSSSRSPSPPPVDADGVRAKLTREPFLMSFPSLVCCS